MDRLIRPGRYLILAVILTLGLAACAPASTGGPSTITTGQPTGASTATTSQTIGASSTTTGQLVGRVGNITVGSKDFTEEFILAEMYAQLLEDSGFTVERKLNLGGTPIAQAAILNGDIDLYPEYTSTGLLTVLKLPPIQDPNQVYQTVKSGYEQQFHLTWLQPAPFNDTQALAMTQAGSDKNGIKTYSDLAPKAPQLVLGGPAEFQQREDGLPALQATYGGFNFKTYQQLGTGSLRYQALLNGQIDVAVAFSTDGEIEGYHLVLLQDDKHVFLVYQAAPVIRMDKLQQYPQIADVLNKVEPLLTDSVMSGLNWQVDGPAKQEPAAVARAFLDQNGL
jgi:osmoprotectant transport system substrate-binding protein